MTPTQTIQRLETRREELKRKLAKFSCVETPFHEYWINELRLTECLIEALKAIHEIGYNGNFHGEDEYEELCEHTFLSISARLALK